MKIKFEMTNKIKDIESLLKQFREDATDEEKLTKTIKMSAEPELSAKIS